VVEEVDEPTWGERDVLIEVRASGVCGSDLHTYRGHHPFRRPPVVWATRSPAR
jgi:L-iditol 2-dehydrogenase